MQKIIILSLILSNSILAEDSQNKEDDLLAKQLFEKAFQKKIKKRKEKKFYLPLKVNNILQDEVLVKINPLNEIFLSKKTIKYISSLLKKEYQKKFIYNEKKEFVTLSEINQFGITSKYNNKDILLEITIPPIIKKASLIKLHHGKKRDIKGAILPHNYVGGANFYINQQYRNNSFNNKMIRESLVASSDLFLNFHDYVLEGRLSYIEDNKETFVRDKFRLVKDDTEYSLRYTLGDIFLPAHKKVTPSESFGLSVEKILNINGGDYGNNVSRINSYEFFIKNKSKVEIYVNNRYRQTLRLPAGTHNLYDLKLPSGVNQVKLKIIEDNGKIEFIDFNDFSYSEVLEQGMMIYGIGIGIHSEKEKNSNKIIYNKKEKIASAYLDYGLTNWLTIESGLQQKNNIYRSIALEFLIGTPFGLLNPYTIQSEFGNQSGYKKGIDYNINIENIYLNIGYDKTDAEYRTIQPYNIKFIDSELYHANINTNLGYGIRTGLSASKNIRENSSENIYGIELSKNFSNGMDIQVNYDSTDQINGENDQNIYFTLNYRWGRQTQLNYTNYIDEKEQIDISYDSLGNYGISSNLSYEKSQSSDRYNLQANINDEKFLLNSSYQFSQSEKNKNQSGSIQLATGIVFAGDKVAITAPITSSFVIVDNDDKLEDSLGIEGYQELDSIVYNQYALPLGDYSEQTLTIDETNLDFGIDLKKGKEKLITNYRTGSTMKITVNNYLSIKGILYDELTDKPIEYKAFKIFHIQTGEKEMGFTNGKGEFTIGGMEEGQYNVSLVQEVEYESIAKFKFDISKEDINKRVINLNKIYLKMPKKKVIKKYKIFKKE